MKKCLKLRSKHRIRVLSILQTSICFRLPYGKNVNNALGMEEVELTRLPFQVPFI